MKKAMTIAYRIGDNLYLNLTNRCPCACTFCIRNNADTVYTETEPLWLDHEPTFAEVRAALEPLPLAEYRQIVFCGYGEPTEALDVLLETADFVRRSCTVPLRLNTNGLGSLINGRDIAPLLAAHLDSVSISLTSSSADCYRERVRPRFGDAAYPAMVAFARRCVECGLQVTLTTVDTTITAEDEERCAELCRNIGATYRIREYAAPAPAAGTESAPVKSQLTTLCYLEKDGCYLMLHRTAKDNDENHDKWIGVGGHFEGTESPEECLVREVKEETGYDVHRAEFRGIVTFVSDNHPAEYICLYTCTDFSGTPIECDEGQLEWVQKEKISSLNQWEGDKLFLLLIDKPGPFFSLKLVYVHGTLTTAILNGRELER